MLHRAKSKDATQTHTTPGPSFMTTDQFGQPPSPVHVSHRSSPLKFFASSATTKPGMSVHDSQKAWTAEYLADLRSNRPVRPSGSRPLPSRNATVPCAPALEAPARASSAMSRPFDSTDKSGLSGMTPPGRSSSAMSHRRAQSALPTMALNAVIGGRPLIQRPYTEVAARDFSTSTATSMSKPSGDYRESGYRWMEKQEAHSLREALEEMDLKEQTRLHTAAQDEASNLVWKHQNPGSPYKNPDAPYNYRQHRTKESHTRSQSIGPHSELGMSTHVKMQSHRSASDGSNSGKSGSRVSSQGSRVASGSSLEHMEHKGERSERATEEKGHALWDSPQKKRYMNLRFSIPDTHSSSRRRSSGNRPRNVSGDSGKGLFRNLQDQIYEEPEEVSEIPGRSQDQRSSMPTPLHLKSRNGPSKVHFAREPPDRSRTAPILETKKLSRYEIHRNPPSQSRNPSYLSNALPPTPPDSGSASDSDPVGSGDKAMTKNGIDVRGEDIRAATSMRLKDRSPKLPTPTVVSDRPGRPIVSFDSDWKPKEVELKQEAPRGSRRVSCDSLDEALPTLQSKPRFRESTASAPVVPTINLPEPPSIQVNNVSTPPIPTISVSDTPSISVTKPPIPTINAPDARSSSRPLPTPKPNVPRVRPLPHHSSTAPVISSKTPWSSSLARRPTAQCAQCALPISGRIVSAAGQRFHPECFVCYHCGEGLECVAFYPEPDPKREERIARIRARADGQAIEEKEGMGDMEDGDEGLRFYCHLDFHEFFSPRCRSCKTPIEGEIVVACGGEWHVGHFFCAECGDPFDSATPFVEKDGYAWCINCHTNRYSTKCRKCRRPVTDMVVKALGAEWHADCFCCVECNGQFFDGRYFLRGESEDPVCVKCEERRLKA
ncbi:MAG: hypothetical protein M1830_008940 [Pleopsidium flavum]|nr:MAG: hypothetical protein M1830_008940 [Pleopsidium flavum]